MCAHIQSLKDYQILRREMWETFSIIVFVFLLIFPERILPSIILDHPLPENSPLVQPAIQIRAIISFFPMIKELNIIVQKYYWPGSSPIFHPVENIYSAEVLLNLIIPQVPQISYTFTYKYRSEILLNNPKPDRARQENKHRAATTPLFQIVFGTMQNPNLESIISNKFRISRDILIIVTNWPGFDHTTHTFFKPYPNYIPKHCYFLANQKSYKLLPYLSQIRVANEYPAELRTVWTETDLTNVSYSTKLGTNLKNFVFFVRIFLQPKGGCTTGRGSISLWTGASERDILICDITARLNLTTVTVERYEFASFFTNLYNPLFSPTDMFFTGHSTKTGFLVPVDLQHNLDFEGILGPIGIEVLLWTVGCGFVVTLFFCFSAKFSVRKLGVFYSIELVIRPLLDQCQEKLKYTENFFRIVVSPWLFYCLIISETYRGELVSYLVHPPKGEAPETFK